MTKQELLDTICKNVTGFVDFNAIKAAVDAYSSASNDAKPIVSGALPPFPDWNEAIKGIDDSRFTTLGGRYEVREGARIMYDRLYSMLTRRQ